MSDALNNLTALQAAYLAEVEREYKLRKYPDTILVERIRQNYPIINDAEKLRQKLNELLVARKEKDAEKTLALYQKKIQEYEKIFQEEQKQLDNIKSIIREVPIIISLLESAIKQLPKLQEEATDTDKKIHKLTTQELKSYLKEMKLLQSQRYKIDLTLKEAMHVGKKSKKIKTKLEKLMNAFERKAENFYESLSLLYKQARAKARSKSKGKSKKSKAKSKTKSKRKSKSKTKKKSKKAQDSQRESAEYKRVKLDDYMRFFHDSFKKLDKDFIAVKIKLHAIVPHPTTSMQTDLAADTLNRILVNTEALKLLDHIRSMQSDFEKIKHKAHEAITQSDDSSADEIQSDIDNRLEKSSKAMLDTSQHSTHLRSAVLNAVSEYMNEQPVKDAALNDKYSPLTQIPATTDVDVIVGHINDILQNKNNTYDERFIKILKNNLSHAFKSIPYQFSADNTHKIIFAAGKTQELVNVDSVEAMLEKKSSLLDKGNALLGDYSETVEKYHSIYRTEQENASVILNLRIHVLDKFHKLKQLATPHLHDSNINLLLGKINQEIAFLSHAKITLDAAQHKANETKTSLQQLAQRISELDAEIPDKAVQKRG